MKRKSKVIFVGKYRIAGNICSAQNVSFEVFNLHSAKENSDFICYFDDGNIFSKYQKLFGKRIELASNKGKIIRLGIFKFILYLFKNRNSIIHIISFEKLGTISVIFKKILHLKVVYTIHGIDKIEENYFLPEKVTHRMKYHLCKYLLQSYSDTIIVPSYLFRKLVLLHLKIPENKILVVPNGISKYFCRFENKNIIVDSVKLFSMANPKWKTKGYDFLYNVIKILDINYELNVICSEDKAVNILSKFNINCYNNMSQENLAKFLEQMNIVLITSKIESFSMLAVEAMALGKICIITDTCGASEYISNYKNGFVVKYSEVDKVINIIRELFYNRELVENISTEAKKIYNVLNWESVYDNYYLKLYS